LKENFDRFKFRKLYKEKRMADFRKYVLAFAGLACTLGVTGTASAQNPQLACTASTASPFDMRAEGVTEQAGDVLVVCTGGTPTASGATIPPVNITVAANANITSRLINGTTNVTDALLLVDDPTPAAQAYCNSPASGCPMVGTGFGGGIGSTAAGNTGSPVSASLTGATNSYSPLALPIGLANGPGRFNAYGGVLVGPGLVTFFGVPIDPPGPTGGPLTLRITNIRMNVSSLGAPAAGSFSTIAAFESISTSAGLTINNPTQNVGNIRRGLIVNGLHAGNTSAGISTAGTPSSLQQCTTASFSGTAASNVAVETIDFSEGFATATKLRAPLGFTPGLPTLATPGNFSNTESQFVPSAVGGFPTSPTSLGFADFATRIKITFNNIQNGVSIFVPTSLNNVGTLSESLQLVASETSGEPTFPAVSATGGVTNLPANFWQVPITSGSGVAVYEVTTQLPASTSTVEQFLVPVLVAFTASPATNSPALGTSTVNVDFAPSTGSTLTATSGPIPRFVPSSTAQNGFTINACQTVLLFPFMSNLAGFDTGFAISSTSTDPFGTSPQSGSCTLNFYGTAAPAAFVTPVIPSATSYTNLLSTVAAGFQGYMIAQCRFQYAHAFAFITDGFGGPGRGLSQGYLALVLPDPNANGGRSASDLSKANKGTGEISGQ
jgi:hypothetical protein